jgi:hypothetical protein
LSSYFQKKNEQNPPNCLPKSRNWSHICTTKPHWICLPE